MGRIASWLVGVGHASEGVVTRLEVVLASCFELIGGVGRKLEGSVVRRLRRFEEIADSVGMGGE